MWEQCGQLPEKKKDEHESGYNIEDYDVGCDRGWNAAVDEMRRRVG